jgi:hypothetical protein
METGGDKMINGQHPPISGIHAPEGFYLPIRETDRRSIVLGLTSKKYLSPDEKDPAPLQKILHMIETYARHARACYNRGPWDDVLRVDDHTQVLQQLPTQATLKLEREKEENTTNYDDESEESRLSYYEEWWEDDDNYEKNKRLMNRNNAGAIGDEEYTTSYDALLVVHYHHRIVLEQIIQLIENNKWTVDKGHVMINWEDVVYEGDDPKMWRPGMNI